MQGYVFQGQDTLYLQKFDVDDRYNGLYWHQYMQNVQAPTSETQTTYQAYKKCGVAENAFVFKIPIYNNMPAAACAKPAAKDQITLNTNEISGLPVSETVTLSAYINGNQDTGAAEQLSGILGKNVELKIQMADGITWSVQGTQISYIPAEGIDMGIKLGNNIIPRETLEQLAGEYDTLEFSLAHEGEYGFTAELSLPVGVQYCGMFANLFYYNPGSGQLEFGYSKF